MSHDYFLPLQTILCKSMTMNRKINRIKVILAERNKTNKWLCDELGVAQTTVSKWVTNSSQPPMETFMRIAQLLEVNLDDLVRYEELSRKTKNNAHEKNV